MLRERARDDDGARRPLLALVVPAPVREVDLPLPALALFSSFATAAGAESSLVVTEESVLLELLLRLLKRLEEENAGFPSSSFD